MHALPSAIPALAPPARLPLPSPLQPAPASAPTLHSVLRLAPPDTRGAKLATRIEIVTAILGVADRVQVLHDSYACQRADGLVSGAELARVRTLALAILCQLARDVAPLAQQRLEQCLFPEDTACGDTLPGSLPMPLEASDAAAAAHQPDFFEADTDPAPFHDTQPAAYLTGPGTGR